VREFDPDQAGDENDEEEEEEEGEGEDDESKEPTVDEKADD
jgi:hypothetical protein